VSTAFHLLSDEEVRQIRLIIETLEHSTFDFLQLEFGGVKLTLGRGQSLPADLKTPSVPAEAAVAALKPTATTDSALVAAPGPPAATSDDACSASAATVTIEAPLLGRFYAAPEPGASPFVSLGSAVKEATTVGLIEVMKTFNAIPAGVSGVIIEICVQDAQFIEYGQALFRVRPAKTA
jgi:acetyl-CoA carboxylase biotin carboxyl carrier protein